MKPIKVICPICGEKMIPENWGMKREVTKYIGGGAHVASITENYVDYVCACGNKMCYSGYVNCWQKKCKCKSCKNFQEVKDE